MEVKQKYPNNETLELYQFAYKTNRQPITIGKQKELNTV
jgi:hypothetical protein